ncbi:hypothetical protein Tco_0896841 [Tanacetum coccineum]
MESQSETSQMVSALKLPVLKTGEYDLWSMRMEQYLTFTDHALWEVTVNGDSVTPVASDHQYYSVVHLMIVFMPAKMQSPFMGSNHDRFRGNTESEDDA